MTEEKPASKEAEVPVLDDLTILHQRLAVPEEPKPKAKRKAKAKAKAKTGTTKTGTAKTTKAETPATTKKDS